MRYVVYGAGAVGGVIGARLHLAGLPTTLVARGAHLARIRATGLVLDAADGRRVAVAPATDSVAGLPWSDDTVVLLCVKGHQTTVALADLARHAPPSTIVVCAQNGVANESAVLRHFERTYALCVMLPSLHLEPGVVVAKCHPTPGILDLGVFPRGVDPTAEAIAADLARAGFASLARPDIMAWKHRKLLVNCVGDVRAIFGPGDATTELAARVLAEGEAVLTAAGTTVVSRHADDERRGDVLRSRPDVAGFPANSLRQSLARGLDSEVDYRIGEIVLVGRLHDVPTPASELVRGAIQGAERGSGAAAAAGAADLLARLTP